MLTGALGVVIGLPALRLSGLYLALITLMAAGAITLLLTVVKFPNGGEWLLGLRQAHRVRPEQARPAVDRRSATPPTTATPSWSSRLVFLLAAWHIKGNPAGRGRPSASSEVTAVAAGVNTTLYKLWAFALSAAVTRRRRGVAGVRRRVSPPTSSRSQNSITLLAVVLLGGVYNLWGAVVAAFFMRVLPQILDRSSGSHPRCSRSCSGSA